VKRERHAVAHLPGLGDRCQDLGGGDILRQALILAALVEQLPGMVQSRGSSIDQRQHRREGIAFPVPVRSRGQIEQPGVVVVDQTDLFPAAGSKCRKFHNYLLLWFDKIYDH
jgi:hypothetical protein